MCTKDSQTLDIWPGMVESQIVALEADRKVVGSGIVIVTNQMIPVTQEFMGMDVEPDFRGNDIVQMLEVYKMSSPL